jgi:hypothetical protein
MAQLQDIYGVKRISNADTGPGNSNSMRQYDDGHDVLNAIVCRDTMTNVIESI